MKIDMSQIGDYWVGMDERQPDSPGEYYVTTSKVREITAKWDGQRWYLQDKEDWVVYWLDVLTDPKTGKTETWVII